MISVVMATSGMAARADCTRAAKELGRGLAPHAFQHCFAPGLQGQVQVAAQAFIPPERKEIRLQVPGFERGQAQARDGSAVEQSGYQFRQALRIWKIASPGAELDTGQHDLLRPAFQRRLHIDEDILHRT